MKRHTSIGSTGGRVKQSGIPGGIEQRTLRAYGLTLPGVVITTYVQMDGESAFPEGLEERPTAVYCDVLTYGTSERLHMQFIKGALVVGGGLHGGRIWKPKATTKDLTAVALSQEVFDPRNMDGDHVLVQFLEDNLNRPIITGQLPHPQMDLGNEGLPEAGHRMRLKVADGTPQLWKHHGSFFGVDTDGNFVVDTTRAHDGELTPTGAEVPGESAANGNQVYRVSHLAKYQVLGVDKDGGNEKFRLEMEDGKLTVQMSADPNKSLVLDTVTGKMTTLLGANKSLEFDGTGEKFTVSTGPTKMLEVDLSGSSCTLQLGGDSLKVEQAGAAAVLTLGDGAKSGMIWEAFNDWATSVLNALNTAVSTMASHIHNATAPGAPTTPSSTWAATWSSAWSGVTTADSVARNLIQSTKLKIPQG